MAVGGRRRARRVTTTKVTKGGRRATTITKTVSSPRRGLSNPDGLGLFKLSAFDVVSTSILDGSMHISVSDSNPSAWMDGDTNKVLQDWDAFRNLYDQYRVCGVKIRYIPYYTENVISTTNGTSNTVAFRPVYVLHDPDSTAIINTVNSAIQFEKFKLKRMDRPWSIYYKIPKANAGGTSVGYGWHDTESPTNVGKINILSSGLNSDFVYGNIIVTYYIAGKVRK